MSNRLQHNEELIVELYPESWTNTNRLRVFYIADYEDDEGDIVHGWFYQYAADPGDIGNEPCGPYKTAKQAYESARDSNDDDNLPSWRTLKNRGWC